MKHIMNATVAQFGASNEFGRFAVAYLGEKLGASAEEISAALGMSPMAAHLAAKSIARKIDSGEFPSLATDIAEIESRLGVGRQTYGRSMPWSGTAPFAQGYGQDSHRVGFVGHARPRAFTGATCTRSTAPARRPMMRRPYDCMFVGVDEKLFRNHRFVIDAMNIAYLGNGNRKGNHPNLANVIAVCRELDRHSAEWQCFWDPFNPNRFVKPGECRRWEQLMRNDPHRQIQVEGMKADLAVLMAASKPSISGLPALIITDDKYRDHAQTLNYPIASDQKRFLRATKVNDEIWIPSVNWSIAVR